MGAKCGVQQDPHELEAQQHLEKHFGDLGEVDNIRRLANVLKRMHEEVFKMPSQHPVFVNLGMVMKQSVDEGRCNQLPTSGKKFTESAVLMRASRYARYAMAANHSDEKDILKAIQGGEGDELDGHVEMLYVYNNAEKTKDVATCPSFFIAKDKSTSDIVLSVRGGATLQDALVDSVGSAAPFLDGHAHSRLLASAQKVLEKAREVLESAFEDASNCSLTFVGHGTGAGVALLATLQAFGESPIVQKLAATNMAKCYAFSAPPVFSGEVPDQLLPNIYSFVYGKDMIPRASLGSMGKLLVALKQVDELEMGTPARLQVLEGSDQAPESFPDHLDIPEELSGELRSLHGVGTILSLSKNAQGNMSCDRVQREQMDRILLHENMFKDHMMAGYEEAIMEVLMQLQKSKGCC